MVDLNKTLKQLGLSQKQAQVYLSVLELGEAAVSDIAKKSGIPRTSVYGPIERLLQQGLLSFYIKRGRRFFVPENPEKLSQITLEHHQDLIKIMPQLKSIYNVPGSKPKIRFYEGKEGIRAILSDILEEKHPLRATTNIEVMNIIISEYFSDFIQKRAQNHLPVKLLANYSKGALELKRRDDKELRKTKFVPQNFSLKNANYVYGNKVAVISLRSGRPMGVVIEDKDIAEVQRMYFDFMWEKVDGSY